MTLKAVLFDFNGVIINDEPIHQQLIDQVLIAENLRPKSGEFRQVCLGRSDRACIRELLQRRGRVVSEDYLTQIIKRKAEAYQQELAKLEKLPTYPGLEDLIFQVRSRNLKLAVVSGALRSEVELVLQRLGLAEYFCAIVAGDDITTSKPEPDGYLLAVERLNEIEPSLNLQPAECLAIEDTPAGITAAKRAKIPVVGVANTYPFHMLQRQANWAVDYLSDLDLEYVQQVYTHRNQYVA
ncbi:HAD-superfamily hydrolase, subfamily IA, variant 3 [Gloeocapsa sp. PCC 7428]|uniref:HAD family hydrolase n=1 Tax=Gloeocapsa sp. PCC 7428 TaxID=1173026 RepID=UPI0002A6188C|nr:HAD family phosphatase [Gloeocapsa sp. PCC 7428]AFZ33174.1 HAD-superfamily hydrolase, subfamily IA, variant 3 [Gloeocapsa sp. PCC 7428]